MKIAWLMPNLHVTGGARTAVELGRQMANRGHQFTIMIPTGRIKLTVPDSVNVIECGASIKSPLLTIPSAMIGMMRKTPTVDVIIGSMPPYALLAHLIGSRRGVTAINYMLSDDVHIFDDGSHIRSKIILSLYHAVARFSIQRVPAVVNSHWTAVKSVANGGMAPVAIVPSGYSADLFYNQPKRDRSDRPVRIVTVGRKQRAKGFADVVKALNLIDRNIYSFELKVISQDILDLSAAQFPYRLVTPEDDEELREHYQWGDLFVHASWSEGFGLPPLEAQACGLGVVSTDSGGVREFLFDGDNCLLVPPRDPSSMANAIIRMIDDVRLRDRLIERGLETCKRFSWDRVADQFEKTLERLTGS